MDVLVTGGTGFLGRHLCAELHGRGHGVTALSRTPAPDHVPDGVATVTGDLTDPDSVAGHVEGKDALVNLVALSPLFQPRGGETRHDVVHRGGTETCIALAESHDVDRFLQMSALGADPDGPTHYLRAKGRAETHVRESTLSWTIVRPSVVFGDGAEFLSFTRRLTPPILAPLPGGGHTPFQPIHVADLVPILAAALESEAHVGQTYEIGGPEVLELADVARLLARARGRSVRVLPVPMALAGLALTLGDYLPGFPMGPDQYRSLRLDNTPDENDIAAFDVSPAALTTLSAYLGVGE